MAMAEEGEEVAAAEAPQKLELSCGGLKRLAAQTLLFAQDYSFLFPCWF